MDEIGDEELGEEIAWLRERRSECEEVDSGIWLSLAAALGEWFTRDGDESCLREAEQLYREMVDRLPERNLARVEALDQLAEWALVRVARADTANERNRLTEEAPSCTTSLRGGARTDPTFLARPMDS